MATTSSCLIASVRIPSDKLVLIAGPCVAESLDLCLHVAGELAALCAKLDISYVFKASYDKANRSSAAGYRGQLAVQLRVDALRWRPLFSIDRGIPDHRSY